MPAAELRAEVDEAGAVEGLRAAPRDRELPGDFVDLAADEVGREGLHDKDLNAVEGDVAGLGDLFEREDAAVERTAEDELEEDGESELLLDDRKEGTEGIVSLNNWGKFLIEFWDGFWLAAVQKHDKVSKPFVWSVFE